MNNSLTCNFLIVGSGVVGLATAQRLLLQGAQVTLLDRGIIGQESSWAGGGILSPLCPWDYPDEVTQLTSRGAALFPQWAADLHEVTGIDPEYDVSGLKILPPFQRLVAQRWCAAHGVALDSVAEQSIEMSFPPPTQAFEGRLRRESSTFIKLDSRLRGNDKVIVDDGLINDRVLFLSDVAQVRNPRLIQALRKHIEMLGGNIIEHCAVRGISTFADRVQAMTTLRGEFKADNFIVCAGAWSKQVLGQHALQLDIKPMRGQILLFKFPAPPLSNIVLQDGMYLIPRRDGHVLIGSTLEDVGFDKSTTIAARNSLQQRAQLLLPALCDMPLVQHWSGLRPASPHNIPTIGRHPHLKNLYVNSGHFRYGVTMAPASAEILLNEMTGAPQVLDVWPYQAGWGLTNS